MKRRVAVLGRGLDGLIAAWILRQHPMLDVRVFGEKVPYDACPMRIVHTESLGALLRAIGVPHSSYSPEDGVLLHGKVLPFKKSIDALDADARSDLVGIVARKACGSGTLVSLYADAPSKRRMRFDHEELGAALAETVVVDHSGGWRLEPGVLHYRGGAFEYDYAAITEPFWRWKQRAWFSRFQTFAMRSHTEIAVEPRELRMLRHWDTILTPYTPGGSIYQITARSGRFVAETAEQHVDDTISDLNFLFPDGYATPQTRSVPRIVRDGAEVLWPESVVPLGEYANPRADTRLTAVIDGAYALMRRWTR